MINIIDIYFVYISILFVTQFVHPKCFTLRSHSIPEDIFLPELWPEIPGNWKRVFIILCLPGGSTEWQRGHSSDLNNDPSEFQHALLYIVDREFNKSLVIESLNMYLQPFSKFQFNYCNI